MLRDIGISFSTEALGGMYVTQLCVSLKTSLFVVIIVFVVFFIFRGAGFTSQVLSLLYNMMLELETFTSDLVRFITRKIM